MLPHIDGKLVVVAALFAVLVLVKLLGGNRPWDAPVRRPRRFGHRGALGPLHGPDAEGKGPDPARAAGAPPPPPAKQAGDEPRDPEKDFFGDS